MEGVAGEGGGDLPYMVGLMEQLVDTTNTHRFSFTHFHTNSHLNPVIPDPLPVRTPLVKRQPPPPPPLPPRSV